MRGLGRGAVAASLIAACTPLRTVTPAADAGAEEGCDRASCEASGGYCDAATACTPCPALDALPAALHVDSARSAEGNGTEACPFRSITSAVRKDRTLAASIDREIRVAAGVYTATTGEDFPLQLRTTLALIGAGSARTIVRGDGEAEIYDLGGAGMSTRRISARIGGPGATVRLEDLAFEPGTKDRAAIALHCSEGTATTLGTPTHALEIDRVRIGPGYETGVVATSPGIERRGGCSLSMRRSTIRDVERGLISVRSGPAADGAVAISLGDPTDSPYSNTFVNVRAREHGAAAIAIGQGTVEAIVARSEVTASDIGAYVVFDDEQQAESARIELRSNTFHDLGSAGVVLLEHAVVDVFEGNQISGVTAPLESAVPAVGMLVRGAGGRVFPKVRSARSNLWSGNDQGLRVEAVRPLDSAASVVLDFGNTGDSGRNTFRCNSLPPNVGGLSHDVDISLDAPGGRVQLEGNAWDHDPIRVSRTRTATFAADLHLDIGMGALAVSTARAELHPGDCPPGRTP